MPRPLREYKIPAGGEFGARRAGGRKHQATDYHPLDNTDGEPIYGTGPGGVVTHIGYNADPVLGLGNNVTVTYPKGRVTVDGHMRDRTLLHVGSAVDEDTVIGYVGHTGNAVNASPPGSHDHHQLTINGVLVDPEKFYGSEPASLDPTRIPEEKVEHGMSIAIFRSYRAGVGEFLVYASPAQVACTRELSTISATDRAFEFRVAQQVALAAGLGAGYEIPTVDDSSNGGWYLRNQILGRIAAMPADFQLSPTNQFIPLVYYARGGGDWVGPSAAEIRAALAADFAAVNANIDDQPTSFDLIPK